MRQIPGPRRLGVPNERILLVGVREQVLVDGVEILAPRRQVLVAVVEILAPRRQVLVAGVEILAPQEQALVAGVEIPAPKQILAVGVERLPVPLPASGWKPMARYGAVRKWFTCLPGSWRRCGCS